MINISPGALLWNATEASVLTGGRSAAPWAATGVCIRLDELKAGDLFFAGPDDDLNEVFKKGAAAAVVKCNTAGPEGLPLLAVPDVFEALRALAAASRFRTHGLVLAVQGIEERASITRFLSQVGHVHAAGRHMSQSLAAMPADCDYGVFGFSPHVRPDIAVVTDGEAALNSTVLDSMPDNGMVLIHADDSKALEVLARARAAGIRSIFTFGKGEGADAGALEFIPAANGRRLSVRVLGQELSLSLPPAAAYTPCLMAALLVLRLSDVSLVRAAGKIAQATVRREAGPSNISLIEAGHAIEAVFKVKNMIDWGKRRRTLIIDKITASVYKPQIFSNKDLEIPDKIDTLDVVCASRGLAVFSDARAAIEQRRKSAKVEEIVPDVLMPGDYVVFRKMRQSSKVAFSQALRLIPNAPGGRLKSDHAV